MKMIINYRNSFWKTVYKLIFLLAISIFGISCQSAPDSKEEDESLPASSSLEWELGISDIKKHRPEAQKIIYDKLSLLLKTKEAQKIDKFIEKNIGKSTHFLIISFSSETPSKDLDRNISESRALQVRNRLINLGIQTKYIALLSFGSDLRYEEQAKDIVIIDSK